MSLKYRICPDCGMLHDVHDWPEQHRFWNESLCAPSVIRDGIDDLWHPSTNKTTDSKSHFRQMTKDSGCEEIGTEVQQDRRVVTEITEADVHTAYQMVEQGYKPHSPTATADDTASVL